MQVGISSEAQLASITENILQEPPESPKRADLDKVPLVDYLSLLSHPLMLNSKPYGQL